MQHVGSAHAEAELGAVLQRASELLQALLKVSLKAKGLVERQGLFDRPGSGTSRK